MVPATRARRSLKVDFNLQTARPRLEQLTLMKVTERLISSWSALTAVGGASMIMYIGIFLHYVR